MRRRQTVADAETLLHSAASSTNSALSNTRNTRPGEERREALRWARTAIEQLASAVEVLEDLD